MGFIARLNFPRKEPPIRAYIHEAGFEEAYKKNIENAIAYLKEVFGITFKEEFNFFLATIWGASTQQRMDLFGFSDINNWPGNPDIYTWQFTGGLYIIEIDKPVVEYGTETTCGDSLIMLGEEEKFRRSRPSLEEYMTDWPHLGEIEPQTSRIIL